MYTYIYTYIHIYIHTYIYTYTYIHTYIHHSHNIHIFLYRSVHYGLFDCSGGAAVEALSKGVGGDCSAGGCC